MGCFHYLSHESLATCQFSKKYIILHQSKFMDQIYSVMLQDTPVNISFQPVTINL